MSMPWQHKGRRQESIPERGGGRFALIPILGKQIQNGIGLAHWILKAENLLMELAFGKGDFQ